MAIVNSQLHLETFIENSQNLPAELVRLLNTIRDLDERSQKLREQLEAKVRECLLKSPQATSAARKSTGEQAREVAEMRAEIEGDHWMLLQFSDEKLALSNQCYDLLDYHLGNLDKEIEAFNSDLIAGERTDADALYEAESFRSKRSRGGDDHRPFGSSKAEAMRRAEEAERVRRAEAEVAAANARQQALLQQQQLQRQQAAAHQLQQEKLLEAEQQAAQHAAEVHQVAVHQASSAANSQQQSFGGGFGQLSLPESAPIATSRIARTQYKHSYKDADPEDDEADGEALEEYLPEEPGLDMSGILSSMDQAVIAAAQPKALPPHLRHYAPQVQAKGRLLTKEDISQRLEGIRAEMWWPDDKSWYLVEIGEVDMGTQQARVIYTTGEIEEISLDEIARDGHLSIIDVQADLW